ncbi:HNH endonuclease [Streptomyces sp. NBC_01744]|uniref:HNH endonuclease n=1 Tax=Streptomyces sp. NBC_01744 TaxID=2975927 RepID=UPI003D9A561D|nr:HNH endonuclease [Streptomyces sp. NBC_01744]
MSIPNRLRFEVFRRDAFRCRYCGMTAALAPMTVDHVKPVVLGGTDELSNLVTCCEPCNSGKSSTPPDDKLYAAIAATEAPEISAVKLYVYSTITHFGVKDAITPARDGYSHIERINAIGMWRGGWRGEQYQRPEPPGLAVEEFECDLTAAERLGFPITVLWTAASWAGRHQMTDLVVRARALHGALHAELSGFAEPAPVI